MRLANRHWNIQQELKNSSTGSFSLPEVGSKPIILLLTLPNGTNIELT